MLPSGCSAPASFGADIVVTALPMSI